MKGFLNIIKKIINFILAIILLPFRLIYEVVDFLYLSEVAKKVIAGVYCLASFIFFAILIRPDIHSKMEISVFLGLTIFFCGVLLGIHFYAYDEIVRFLDIILAPVAEFQSDCFDRIRTANKRVVVQETEPKKTDSYIFMEEDALVDLEFFIRQEQVLYPTIPYCKYLAKPCENKW